MDSLQQAKRELAIANRILSQQGLFDEDGHISLRHPAHPERYLLARALNPTLVKPRDIMEFTLAGDPVVDRTGELCIERFIHGAVLESRPDIQAVLYASSEDLLPFGISRTPFQPVIASVGDMGMHVPVWDIADAHGDSTDLLVSTPERARDLARRLGPHRVVLIRGGGLVATGRSLNDVVRMSIYLPRNARALTAAIQVGEIKTLSEGETRARLAIDPESNAMRRGWEYWARQAGCEDWLTE